MHSEHAHHHTQVDEKSIRLVKTASGSLAKTMQMVEEGRYCPEIIQQIDSVIGLLQSTRENLLKGHLESCLVDRLSSDKDGTIKELLKIYHL